MLALLTLATSSSAQPATGVSPENFLDMADRAIARGQFDEALALARRAPNDPSAAAVRARIEIARGRHADAEGLLKPAAAARPEGEAALELGLLNLMLGRKAEAIALLNAVVDRADGLNAPRDLFRAARAARALGDFREANRLFREAASADPASPAINTGWGDLFLEKYNRSDAVRSYQAALRADPDWAPAHLGLARALADDNPPGAKAAASRALTLDPTYVAAHLLTAELALDDGDRGAAKQSIARALEVNASSLEAHALAAAIANLEGRSKDFDAEVGKVLAINPAYGEVYRVAGDLAARNYRFDEAVVLASKAMATDPDNVRAQADLGIHLLRTGDESGARQALDRAFRADPYDVVTYNLLGLFDSLQTFETIEEGDITLRMHGEEAAVLREYALPLAREALGRLSERYRFTPRGPILIEIFPRHDDFAVRNVGLPGMIGALGACFGRVVTMDSPRARPPGTFNWGATLWHEMAHVITLQMSSQRVPRWLTEGISVYEEKQARPEWGRDMEVAFAQAMNRGEVLKLGDLNAGFQKPETISLAYYQASLLVGYLVDTFGDEGIQKLLRVYGEGLETDQALTKALGTSLDRLQVDLDRNLERTFGVLSRALKDPEKGPAAGDSLEALKQAAAAQPDKYALQVALGQALRTAGDLDSAIAALNKAVKLVPMATGRDSARLMIVDIAEQKGDLERAMRELETLLGYDHVDVESARRLAKMAKEATDQRRLRLAYERIVDIDPFDPLPHAELGRMALTANEADVAMREFRAALATGPVDRAAAHCDLAESYVLAGRLADARKQVIAALEIAPTYERAQDILLKVVEGRP
ncbi:MAG: tetratricopeptide repeat protein [Acidobacteria bacterium]|nr:tetratricopeptide repeat protein [Acidobacteriota bacterium]